MPYENVVLERDVWEVVIIHMVVNLNEVVDIDYVGGLGFSVYGLTETRVGRPSLTDLFQDKRIRLHCRN